MFWITITCHFRVFFGIYWSKRETQVRLRFAAAIKKVCFVILAVCILSTVANSTEKLHFQKAGRFRSSFRRRFRSSFFGIASSSSFFVCILFSLLKKWKKKGWMILKKGFFLKMYFYALIFIDQLFGQTKVFSYNYFRYYRRFVQGGWISNFSANFVQKRRWSGCVCSRCSRLPSTTRWYF